MRHSESMQRFITVKGKDYDFTFDNTPSGLRLSVWVYADNKEWERVSSLLYPLMTNFEALCAFASEHFGDSVFGEDLAQELGIPMVTSDDAECIKCHKWEHYEEMVHGTDANDLVAEKLGMSNWDYVCAECYFPEYWLVEEKVN